MAVDPGADLQGSCGAALWPVRQCRGPVTWRCDSQRHGAHHGEHREQRRQQRNGEGPARVVEVHAFASAGLRSSED